MLGGPVYIAFIRFLVSLIGVVLLFTRISEPRFDRKKAAVCYGCFCIAISALVCIWYLVDWDSCVRMSAFTMYLCFAMFAFGISRDSACLKIYKLTLIFYFMAFFVIGGLEISILLFDRNVWADIFARIVLFGSITILIDKYVKKPIQEFGLYVEKEADRFSVAVMIISILFGIGYILNPSLNQEGIPYRIYQLVTNFLLTGTLQLLVFHFYLHVGKEKEYARENQLMQMNYRLLERQLEILEESLQTGRKIRHDARHHNAVIAEYARKGQNEELLQYLKEYEAETDTGIPEIICANTAVNHILTAYTRKARRENINVTLDVSIGRHLAISSIDLVAILANAYENAIYACMEVKKLSDGRECFIRLMLKKQKQKLMLSCSNTCRMETKLKDGQPGTEFTGGIGVSSMIAAARKYGGEYDFQINQGVFVFRLIMNEPATETQDRSDTADTLEWRDYDISDSAL